ncbi:DNA adenine methylase [Sphingomonas sp.]|uniref:DNA adenine methylase n=1 Tax=Sphingomonas sp. TaxID=28214 RepID=UPI001D22B314|nr:DNA adenine methylase [Sphingomonas sp.]MBX9797804.1 DNA adenine methylase [Sphingomonas sp.]
MESIPQFFPDLQSVSPAKPIAPYLGGKRALAKRLCAMIASVPHDLYAEPFVGMGGVFLGRAARPRHEVINDLSTDVATLFRILQRHYQPFLDTMKWKLSSRSEFNRLLRQDPTTLTDLERSARFLYLQRLAFGGKVTGRGFGVDTSRSRFNLGTLAPMLDDLHERLQGVTIEALPYDDFIRRYDRQGTLFYLDPPYWGCEEDYGPGFERADFQRLATRLQGLCGRFIMSVGDRPELRDMFSWAVIQEVELTYHIGMSPTRARELIISN